MIEITRKLGKLPKREDPRTLKLARYLVAEEITFLPTGADWTQLATQPWGTMANDRLGDCALAAPGHMVQAWTANAQGAEVTISDADIVKAYSAVGGYVPGKPSTDNGCNMLDVLRFWKSTGIGGRKIAAYVEFDPTDRVQVRAAHWLFGGAYLGFGLPLSAQSQAVWEVTTGPNAAFNSWGGHATASTTCDLQQCGLITWGYFQPYSYAFLAKYADEAYAVLSEDWMGSGSTSVQGFNLEMLRADLAKLAQL